MLVRATKQLGDGFFEWQFGAGYSSYKKENLAVGQDCVSAILEWKNDAFWALNNGIDWRVRLGNKNQKELLDADIVNIIKKRYGVLTVNQFESNIIDRSYYCKCDVYTIYSQQPLQFSFNKGL